MEIPLVHWIQWTNKIPMDISRSIGSIGSNGHFRLAISMAQYLHDVHMLVITSFKYMVIDQLKKQMSDGNSTCPLHLMDKQNSSGHLQVHWTTGSNGHFRLAISMAQYQHEVHGLVITSFKYMLIDELKKQMSDGNSTCPLNPMDKQNSNGHFQVHWIHWIQWTLSFGYINGTVST
jgi:uncharacterized membrane protein YukC